MIKSEEMDDIPEYSTAALNVLKYFHDCDVIIFVEGDDDILFWDVISNKAGITTSKIESAGGKNELIKKMQKIINENAQIIVACDLDHAPFLDNIISHKQIVRTYGYSIENSMYCPASVLKIIKKLSRTIIKSDSCSSEWLQNFVENARRLLIYDIANHKYQKGISVLGDNCSRFLKSNKSIYLSDKKIKQFLKSIQHHFTDEEIIKCEELVRKDSRELRHLIKGHFLTNVIINIIKKRVFDLSSRKPNLFTPEHLFTETVDCCIDCNPSECDELLYMVNSMNKAYKEIQNRQQRH